MEDEAGRSSGQGAAVFIQKEAGNSGSKALKNMQTSKLLEDFTYGTEIRPPVEPEQLLSIVEQSDILPPLIEAMAGNAALFGWGVKYKDNFDYSKAPEEIQAAADAEWTQISNIFTYFNLTESFERLIYRAMIDQFSIGWGMVEILRDGAGNICGGEYAQGANFRIATVANPNEQYADVTYMRKTCDREVSVTHKKRFRKFVQTIQGQVRYFKEFGDPRPMDCLSGVYSDSVPPERLATEVLMFTGPNPSSPYGLVPWIGGVADILGYRKASEVNLDFFINGKMIPFAVLSNGGVLTNDSIEALRTGKGTDNFFKCLIIESKPPKDTLVISDDTTKQPSVDVKIQPLTDTTLHDGLFQEYQEKIREKVRSMFRLPPIYLGNSSDYTRATADTAKLIAEEQVLKPLRNDIAAPFNMVLEYELNLKYCEMYFKGPNLSNMAEVAAALQPFIDAGTATPNMLIDALGELLGKDLEPVLPDELGNVPIAIMQLQAQGMAADGEQMEAIQKSATIQTLDNVSQIIKDYLGDGNGD